MTTKHLASFSEQPSTQVVAWFRRHKRNVLEWNYPKCEQWMFLVNLFCNENWNFLHVFLGEFVRHCNRETLLRSFKECRAYSGQTGSSCNRPSFDKNLREWLSSQSDSCHLGKSQMGDRATCAHCSSWRNFGSITSSCKRMYQNSHSKSINQLVDNLCALVSTIFCLRWVYLQ